MLPNMKIILLKRRRKAQRKRVLFYPNFHESFLVNKYIHDSMDCCLFFLEELCEWKECVFFFEKWHMRGMCWYLIVKKWIGYSCHMCYLKNQFENLNIFLVPFNLNIYTTKRKPIKKLENLVIKCAHENN